MPLRRSLTFWLGLLGLVSIGIAWVDSTRYRTSFAFHRALGLHGHSSLDIGYSRGSSYRRTDYFERNVILRKDQLRFARLHWWRTGGGYLSITIPHWIILLAYAEVWIVLLVWRRRRIRHAMTTIPLGA
jgi:hypothetical protein